MPTDPFPYYAAILAGSELSRQVALPRVPRSRPTPPEHKFEPTRNGMLTFVGNGWVREAEEAPAGMMLVHVPFWRKLA